MPSELSEEEISHVFNEYGESDFHNTVVRYLDDYNILSASGNPITLNLISRSGEALEEDVLVFGTLVQPIPFKNRIGYIFLTDLISSVESATPIPSLTTKRSQNVFFF